MISENKPLEIPEDIYLGEEIPEGSVVLDFDLIKETAKLAKKKFTQKKSIVDTISSEFSEKEDAQIDNFVKDLEKYVVKYASIGKEFVVYDCSKIQTQIFFEIAKRFKQANPKFFVTTHAGTQFITVNWSGKNEV